jgi:hypothetical protein
MRFLLTVLLVAYACSAQAHDAQSGFHYEAFCCNGDNHTGDCQMIPAKNVKITTGGYDVSLAPGDHRLVTRLHLYHLPQRDARRSQDGAYHLCLYPDENTPRCFYAPDLGF